MPVSFMMNARIAGLATLVNKDDMDGTPHDGASRIIPTAFEFCTAAPPVSPCVK